MKKYFLFPFLLLVFIIPVLLPLIHKGFFLSDDGNWMVIRFSAFYEVLRSGEFPVRFLTRLNNGFGYPVSDFLYPLFMYLGVPIHLLGANFVETIKIIFAGSLVFSAVFIYLWLKKLFDNISSFIGSVFYTFFPYHLYDVYKRGSVGEVLALTILPFILWQIERKSLVFVSLGVGLLILAHNTLALLFLPLIFIYALLRNKKQVKFILLSILLGMGLSAFFSIPAVYDTRFTAFASTQVSEFSKYLLDLKDYGLIGIVSFVLLFSTSILLFLRKELAKNNLLLLSVASSFIVIYFTTSLSRPLWEFVPFTNLIQFPFRLISLLLVFFTFQLGFIINLTQRNKKLLISAVFLVLIFVSAKPYLVVKDYQYFPDSYYSTNQDTTTVRNEYMPKWIKEIPKTSLNKIEVLNGKEKISLEKVTPREIVFNTYLPIERTILVSIVYFPGWNVYVNKQKVIIDYEKNGLIQFDLNKGQNNVRVVFEETNVRILSDILSIISLITLLILIYLKKIKKIKI